MFFFLLLVKHKRYTAENNEDPIGCKHKIWDIIFSLFHVSRTML